MTPVLKILNLVEFERYFDEIAILRFDYFGQFPYLYAGRNLEDEFAYLSGYLKHADGRIMAFFGENNELLAMCTGFPLAYDMGEPFNVTGWVRGSLDWEAQKIRESYYLGEVIVKRNFRDTNILKQILQYGALNITQHGYRYLTFITVERDKDHPMRPNGHRDFGDKLHRFKFEKLDMIINGPYNTFQIDGSYRLEDNPMAVWVKDLQLAHSILR